jgi:D-arabinose 1-dehydrogenase-like Zn-dependent alcohol dehydrogenase
MRGLDSLSLFFNYIELRLKGDLLFMGSKKKEAKEKPLEKMTAKELREVAIEMSEITGVHGMNKSELINAIKLAKGIEIESGKKTDSKVREIKTKIKEFKAKRETLLESNDNKMAAIYKLRIIKLKKKTRKAA